MVDLLIMAVAAIFAIKGENDYAIVTIFIWIATCLIADFSGRIFYDNDSDF